MRLSTVHKAFLAVIAANIIWGAAASIFKVSLTNIPPFTLAFWRFFLAALLLLVMLGRHVSLPFKGKRDLLLLAGYALTGITLNITFFFWGIQKTHSINAPIIASGAPIFTLILALLFLKEPFRWRTLIGMLLGAAGMLTIVLQPMLEKGVDGSIVGNIFLVIAVAAAVVQTIIGKKALAKFAAIPFTFWAFLVGAASFLPLAVYEYLGEPTLYTALDWRGYMGLAFGAILSSAAAYSLYAWGLSKISATDTSMFTYLDPVVGTVLGAVFLHEPVTGLFLFGALLIFLGIAVAEGRFHYPAVKILPKKTYAPTRTPSADDGEQTRPKTDKHEVLKKIFSHDPPDA